MFDIHCPHCGEAWDQDYLHNPAELDGLPGLDYAESARRFKLQGCGLFRDGGAGVCNAPPVLPPETLRAIKYSMTYSHHPDEWAPFM